MAYSKKVGSTKKVKEHNNELQESEWLEKVTQKRNEDFESYSRMKKFGETEYEC